MRTRKSNKAKRFSYSESYELDSEENAEDLGELQDADADVDFEEPAGGEEGHGESAGDDDDDEVMNDADVGAEGLSEDEKLGELPQDGGKADSTDTEEEEEDDGGGGTAVKPRWTPNGRAKWKLKLLERGTVHVVPEYPSDLRQTRMHDGPLKSWTRAQQLLVILYGPEQAHIQVMRGLLRKWFHSQTLPNISNGEGGMMHSPWLAEDYEDKERRWSQSWYGKYRAASHELQKSRKIRSEHIDMFKPPPQELICFIGPFHQQQQIRTSYGSGNAVAQSGEPLTNESSAPRPPKGWLLDTGGIPLSIGWAPLRGHREQFLAVCTVPYADQELKEHDARDADAEEKKRGSVQIWSIPCHREDASPAHLVTSLQFDFGRSKRIQWCPVAPPNDHTVGMLAVLCGDGQARVLEVLKSQTVQDNYGKLASGFSVLVLVTNSAPLEWILSPVATLGFTNEYMVQATCLTWVNTNRVCLGHSDGSVSLWSVYPQCMLMRRSVHNSHILDIASGFPSHPYHIATSPVSGSPTLTDLNLPSAETTCIPIPNALNFQPNLLDWNDHLQGYFNMYPSPTPHKIELGWSHVRYFVESRVVITTSSPLMCVASGRTHPFTLVGCADGSLWTTNPLRVLIKDKSDDIHKLKIMEHEFRPAPRTRLPDVVAPVGEQQQPPPHPVSRGAVRILQGFKPEVNSNPQADLAREQDKPRFARWRRKKPSKGSSRRKANNAAEAEESSSEEEGPTKTESMALVKALDRSKAVIHEARTRITAAAWNPNIEYGWWAAAAMGSGLVKIMDLGIGE